jgi:hypothetical protein
VDAEGIDRKHAFSLLRVIEHQQLKLLQLRNPWGSSYKEKWKGVYSDLDLAQWTPELRSATGYDPDTDFITKNGFIWMPLSDFHREFITVNVTPMIKLVNDGGTWHKALVRGEFTGNSLYNCTQVLVTLYTCCDLHLVLAADGGDTLGIFRSDNALPEVILSQWQIAGDLPLKHPLIERDFWSINGASRASQIGSSIANLGVVCSIVPVDPSLGRTVVILVESTGGALPTRGFSLTVCAEAQFDVSTTNLASGTVNSPVSKVSDIGARTDDKDMNVNNDLPPVPTMDCL